MMSLALAKDVATVQRIRRSWDDRTRHEADRNLRLDPLFSLLWTSALALADLWAGDQLARRGRPGAGCAECIAWAQWLAAALATAKDAMLLALLRGRTQRMLAPMARWVTIVEIATKGTGFLYAVVGIASAAADLLAPVSPRRRQGGPIPESLSSRAGL
jgi:hypothetical protein